VVCDEDGVVNMLTADGVHVDVLKNNVNLSAVGPYFLGINFTDMIVSIVLVHIVYAVSLSRCLNMSCTCQSAVTGVHYWASYFAAFLLVFQQVLNILKDLVV